jgi:hypothetical protein
MGMQLRLAVEAAESSSAWSALSRWEILCQQRAVEEDRGEGWSTWSCSVIQCAAEVEHLLLANRLHHSVPLTLKLAR